MAAAAIIVPAAEIAPPARRLTRLRRATQAINPHLLVALAVAFVYHGGLLLSGTFKRTYDAYVHIFLADHYARAWFDSWDYRWYTGFTVTSYPPGSHQTMAILSHAIGLLNAFIVVQLYAVLVVTVGIYRFSRIWVSEEAAGYAALLAVGSSAIAETVHVFGQLPTMFSLGFLLNAIPFVRRWLDRGGLPMLIAAISLTAATTAAHHVTTLFGSVFFVGPVIASAIVEKFREPLPDEPGQHPGLITRRNLRPHLIRRLRRVIPVTFRAGIYGVGLLVGLIGVVLPYWLWSKADPITQVSIPHASRDSFIQNPNAGIVFWLLPWGIVLVALPYAFYKGLTTRAWPMALSLALLTFFGTGGTTPLPKLLLGGAFEILTLDRFTFWATITVLPLVGEFVVSLRHGGLAHALRGQFGSHLWRTAQAALLIAYLAFSVFTANFTQFRRFQPDPIDAAPIITFMDKDQHARWRYLMLGFGDQMAWVSAQMTATTVDGNYHSARRLPEMTTTPVERLEGAKFRGIPGIGSLQQFLAVPDKYNLKYVFSNDQFYDPLLFFSGWHRVQRLENGVVVWERADIAPLPEVLPRRDIPLYQRLMWGLVPMSAISLAWCLMLIASLAPVWAEERARLARKLRLARLRRRLLRLPPFPLAARLWGWADGLLLRWSALPTADDSGPLRWQLWLAWVKRLRHIRPRAAPRRTRAWRTLVLLAILLLGVSGVALRYLRAQSDPITAVQAYYDDLDFRRFGAAYARLDPASRPSYDQYLLELSVNGGLVASYGKLDAVRATILAAEPDRVVVDVATTWITALNAYPTTARLTLVRRAGHWLIVPAAADPAVPPDQFLRQGTVSWHAQGRGRPTTETTAMGDVLDRPQIQILSARTVEVAGRYSVVGELLNTDANPADVTVTALLFDADGKTLATYNAQTAMIHKLFPKEVTPFRVDFEGVAGAALGDTATAGDFKPGAYSPVALKGVPAAFDVYAKAVVTDHDLDRDVAVQDAHLEVGTDGRLHLIGQLLNSGTVEATLPHLLVTLYDAQGRVAWVESAFVEQAVRPQRMQPFDVALSPPDTIRLVLEQGGMFSNILANGVAADPGWRERLALPPGDGYAALRVSVHYFVGVGP